MSHAGIQGFPGVSYVAGDDGHQVGKAADRTGDKGGVVELRPGRPRPLTSGSSTSMTTFPNPMTATCRRRLRDDPRPHAVRGLARVVLPKSSSTRRACRWR
ncbi:DUF4232 domain-containing protein [Amycolatopsis sp. NPDC057786]|uniref:DUF4232 domain-containing protein n=1 Tax=Amycolatopsis sp. NPDC057786 TaxID=3346250 RepID=UPI003670DBCB